MGIKINVNTILRQEIGESLEVGREYPFAKDGLTHIADDIQVWLASTDWLALAEIQITSQTRENGETNGTFVVEHVYSADEQEFMTGVFKRMYGWE